MKKWICAFAAGILAGSLLAMNYEDELDDMMYKARKTKRKMIRQMREMDLER